MTSNAPALLAEQPWVAVDLAKVGLAAWQQANGRSALWGTEHDQLFAALLGQRSGSAQLGNARLQQALSALEDLLMLLQKIDHSISTGGCLETPPAGHHPHGILDALEVMLQMYVHNRGGDASYEYRGAVIECIGKHPGVLNLAENILRDLNDVLTEETQHRIEARRDHFSSEQPGNILDIGSDA